MSFLTDSKFNSLTVLLAALIPSGLTYFATSGDRISVTANSNCDFDEIVGHIESSPSDRWEFRIQSSKIIMNHPATGGSGSGTAKVVCAGDRISFKRNIRIASAGQQADRECFHFGEIDDRKVHGTYACKTLPATGQLAFKWDAVLNNSRDR